MSSALRIVLPPLLIALMLCAALAASAADRAGTIELLDESHGPLPAVPCTMPNCATVISITHHLGVETVKSDDGPGVYFSEEVDETLYPAPPLAPPIEESTKLEKQTQLWEIAVQMQDGTIQTVQQDFEPLFSIGARVVLDGDQVRLWE